jgi:hypothetical protein
LRVSGRWDLEVIEEMIEEMMEDGLRKLRK